jgi:hypothetical protein
MAYRSALASSLVRRTWWITRIESAVVQGNYSDNEVHREVRIRVPKEEDAFLIASLTENGYHAPALDFDFSVESVALSASVTRLTFPGRVVTARRWRRLLKRMAGLGLLRKGFQDDPVCWIDPSSGGMSLELGVPVQILPSSTPGHHHVYIDAEMKWRPYRALCKAMVRVGLLESAFVDLMISHSMSMLLRPGLTKLQLYSKGGALPGKDIAIIQVQEYPK